MRDGDTTNKRASRFCWHPPARLACFDTRQCIDGLHGERGSPARHNFRWRRARIRFFRRRLAIPSVARLQYDSMSSVFSVFSTSMEV